MVRGGGNVAQRRACLRSASAPEVPFCAAATRAMAVVLACRSAPERVQSAVPSVTSCRGRFCIICRRDSPPPCLLLLPLPAARVGRPGSRSSHVHWQMGRRPLW